MTVLTYQSLFFVPTPAAVTQTPVQGVDKFNKPAPLAQPRFRRAAMAATGAFLVLTPADQLTPWQDVGGQVQPPQPPHFRAETKGATLARGDEGVEAAKINFVTPGWEVQPWQPPRREPDQKGAFLRGVDGIDLPLVAALQTSAYPFGYDEPYVYPRKVWSISGAVAPRSDGVEGRFGAWINDGWEQTASQPPQLKTERGSALTGGDLGAHAQFVAWRNVGWQQVETQPVPHASVIKTRASFLEGDDGSQSTLVVFYPRGWDVRPFQPPHPRPERRGAILEGDDGAAGRLVDWENAGWEIAPFQPPHFRPEQRGAMAPKSDGADARFIVWRNAGWETQAVQPPQTRPERSSAQVVGDAGIQGVMPSGLQTGAYPFGYDEPFVFPRKNFARWAATAPRSDGVEARFVNWRNAGWEVQAPQPLHRNAERRIGLPWASIEPRFWPFFQLAVPVQPFQPPRPRWPRWAAVAPGATVDARFIAWRNAGAWDLDPARLRRPLARGGAVFQVESPGKETPRAAVAWFEGPAGILQRRSRPRIEGAMEPFNVPQRPSWGFFEPAGWSARHARRRLPDAIGLVVPPPPASFFFETSAAVIRRAARWPDWAREADLREVAPPAVFSPLLEILFQPPHPWHPAAAALATEPGSFLRFLVPVFYARSIVAQLGSASVLAAAGSSSALAIPSSPTTVKAAGSQTDASAARSETVLKGEPG